MREEKKLSFVTKSMKFLEVGGAVLLIIFGAFFCFKMIQVMMSASLWHDELYSIYHFSSRGPLVSLTDYHVPNNHIFFNLLNSLLPDSSSVMPWRARVLSLLATLAAVLVPAAFFFARRLIFEGALVFFLIAANRELLDLSLQARGYGLALMCAALCVWFLFKYAETPRAGSLFGLVLFSFVGTWTIPTFAFFASSLLILLFLTFRRRQILYGALAYLGAVTAAYLPVASQFLTQAKTFGQQWGYQFQEVSSVVATITQYLLKTLPWGNKGWFQFLFLVGICFALASNWVSTQPLSKPMKLALASSLLFFTSCLFLRTPLTRTCSFTAVPLAAFSVWLLGRILRGNLSQRLYSLLFLVVALSLCNHCWTQIKGFRFIPQENWLEVSRFLRRGFFDSVTFFVDREKQWLAMHYPESPPREEFSAEEFLAGKQVYLQVVPEKVPPPAVVQAVPPAIFPQRRYGGYMAAFVRPPLESHIKAVQIDHQNDITMCTTDRDITSRWTTGKSQKQLAEKITVRVEFDGAGPWRAVHFICANGDVPGHVKVWTIYQGQRTTVPDKNIWHQTNHLMVVLSGQLVERLELEVGKADTDRYFSLNEIWAYPDMVD